MTGQKGKQKQVPQPIPTSIYPNVRLHWLILASFSPIPPPPEGSLDPQDVSWKACFPQWFWEDPSSAPFQRQLQILRQVDLYREVVNFIAEMAASLDAITDYDLQRQESRRLASEIGRRQAVAEASCGVSGYEVPECGRKLLALWLRSPPWTDFNAYREQGQKVWNADLRETLRREEASLQSFQDWMPSWGTGTKHSDGPPELRSIQNGSFVPRKEPTTAESAAYVTQQVPVHDLSRMAEPAPESLVTRYFQQPRAFTGESPPSIQTSNPVAPAPDSGDVVPRKRRQCLLEMFRGPSASRPQSVENSAFPQSLGDSTAWNQQPERQRSPSRLSPGLLPSSSIYGTPGAASQHGSNPPTANTWAGTSGGDAQSSLRHSVWDHAPQSVLRPGSQEGEDIEMT